MPTQVMLTMFDESPNKCIVLLGQCSMKMLQGSSSGLLIRFDRSHHSNHIGVPAPVESDIDHENVI